MVGSDFMEEIEVVRNSELKAGYSTLGIVREKAFESIGRYVIVSKTIIASGAVSDWHHHGKRHLYGFLESGRMRLEYGEKGASSVDVGRVYFCHIRPGLVHRGVTPDNADRVGVLQICVGIGGAVSSV